MGNFLLVMLGGGIGSVLRYLISEGLKARFKMKHWATFFVNVTGCFMLGLLLNHCLKLGEIGHTLVIAGVLGSYTTFSAFEYENIDLIAHEKYSEFLKYSFFSCLFSFIAVGVGFYLAETLSL